MKNSSFYKSILLVLVAVFTYSCVEDDDFQSPDLTVNEPVLETAPLTIDGLYGQLIQAANAQLDDLGIEPGDPGYEQALNGLLETFTITFEEGTSYVEGYVISSDEAGNFFEEIIIQNTPSNPTRGVRFLIDVNPLSTTYELGRKVFIKLNGLSAGISNGVFTIGTLSGTRLDKVAAPLLEDTLLRSSEIATLEPLELSFQEEFTAELTNLYVRFTDVQFNRNDALGDTPKTYAAEPSDEFDGERILEDCTFGGSIIFSTSTFSDFKAVQLPSGKGVLDGILTYNFFGDTFNIVVNDPSFINFDSTDRCDPPVIVIEEFACTGTNTGGGSIFWSENFEQFNAIEEYVDAGWTNTNVVNATGERWVIGDFSSNNYAEITGFSTDEAEIKSWLVTPEINMDNTTMEELYFEIQANFDNGRILRVVFSNNYTGDIAAASWNELTDVLIPIGPSGGFGDFEEVGPIDMSCVDGTINIAFLYEGSDPDATTRYHVDNIELRGN